MGDTSVTVLVRINNLAAYGQQRPLGAFATPPRARVPGNAPPQQNGGAAPDRPACIQPEKMKLGPMMIAPIIKPRPP
jgi:hypothetical protein